MMVRLELGKETTVTSRWYDIWAAAIAIRQMCVLQGRSGQAIDIGMSFQLLAFLDMLCPWLDVRPSLTTPVKLCHPEPVSGRCSQIFCVL